MSKTPYVYVAVRKDIPLADQLVQAGHVCLEAGFSFERPDQQAYMVLLQVKNEVELQLLAEKLEYHRIRFELFHEPDDNMGYTALATEPIFGNKREHLRDQELWRP